MNKAISFCRAVEASRSQSKVLDGSEQSMASVHSVNKKRFDGKKSEAPIMDKNKCMYCGSRHVKGRCPAFGKTCKKCLRKNHFAAVCQSQGGRSEPRKSERVHEVTQESDSEGEEFFVSSIEKQIGVLNTGESQDTKMWLKNIEVEGTSLNFKLDTGAEVSVLPLQCLNKNLLSNMKKSNVTLVAYGNTNFRIKPVGEITLKCRVREKQAIISFVVVDKEGQMPLLGLSGCIDLHLIERVDSVEKKIL